MGNQESSPRQMASGKSSPESKAQLGSPELIMQKSPSMMFSRSTGDKSSRGSSLGIFMKRSASNTSISSLEKGKPIHVAKGLYLGNRELAILPEKLNRQYGITYILNVSSSFKEPSPSTGIVGYKNLAMDDDGNSKLEEIVGEALAFIREGMAKGKVFVHCRLGCNRSVVIVLAFLMFEHKMTLRQAYDVMKKKHPGMLPHKSYIQQLGDFEEKEFQRPRTMNSSEASYGEEDAEDSATGTPIDDPAL